MLRPADTPAVLDVYFPDGRPFHRMGFAGQSSQDVHWCDPDTYRVTYTVLGPDECGYRWDVTGPAKDQLLESSLRRLDPARRPRHKAPAPAAAQTQGLQSEPPHCGLRRLRL